MQKLQEYTERSERNSNLEQPANLPYELDKIAKSYYFIRIKLNEIEQRAVKASAGVRLPEQ